MELPCCQETVAGPYPEPDKSISHDDLIFEDYFNVSYYAVLLSATVSRKRKTLRNGTCMLKVEVNI